MKKVLVAAAVLGLMLGAAQAQEKLTSDSTVGAILDNPKGKEVFTKHLPDFAANPQLEAARPMTLRSLQQFAPTLTDDKLKEIDADLAKIPAK